MLTDETASLEEVAAALGRRPSWLRRNWHRLSVEQGFPRKLPCGPVWPRALVAAWLRAGGFAPAVPDPVNDNLVADPKAAFRAAMSQRYGVEP